MFHLLRRRSFAALTLTQFLGAFNDNAFKQLVLLVSLSTALPWITDNAWIGDWGQSAALAAFALPFILFGVLTGAVADRFSKRRVMVLSNAAEIGVMALGGLAFATQRFELVIAVLFLMGLQSTFFGPSKYGSIPELTEPRDLSRANGLIQMSTSIAIVLGTSLGGMLFERHELSLMWPVAAFVTISCAGFLSSLLLEPLPARAAGRKLSFNPLSETRRQLGLVKGDRALVLAILASAFFYLVGAVLMLVINQYGVWLELSGGEIAMLLAILSLGIGAGSLVAAELSGDRIESGLIPAGLVGMAVGSLAVLFEPSSVSWLRVCLFATGAFAGLFAVPIRALIQHRPAAENRGSVLGLSEVLDFVGILMAAGIFALLNGAGSFEPPAMMAVVGAVTLVFALASMAYTMEFALRFWLAIVFRTLYRIRTIGIGNVPSTGGALIVVNHLSFVDAFLVSAAIGRPVRFMMYRSFFDLPLVGAFARKVKAIPVSGEDSRADKQASMEFAAELLRSGEIVCIFAEGSISRTGSLMGFRRGLERIAKRSNAPILPVALDGVWGSIFSFDQGRFFWKWPKNILTPVTVSIGKALPCDTPAWEVRGRVQHLITMARRGNSETLTERFLRSAKRHRKRTAIVDSGGTRLTYKKLLVSVLALRGLFARRFAGEQRVGIFLPPGAGAALAHLATIFSGKVPIHLNYSLGLEDLKDPIERASLRHVISSPRFLKALECEPPLPGEGTVMLESLAGELRSSDKLAALLLSWLPAFLLVRAVRPVKDPAATATILFSSGSTGKPKGVVLSHRNVLSNLDAFSGAVHLTEQDVLLGVLPFFHSFGHTVTLWAPLLSGTKAVYHARPTDGARIGELCAEERVTISLATPTFYQAWMRRIPAEAFAHLRLAVTGAEKLQARFHKAFVEKYGHELYEGYGCTELSPVVSVNLPDLAPVPEHESGKRAGSVGRPLPGISLRIQDPETHAECGPGQEGSVLVSGPNVMVGYLDDPVRTAAVLQDGWYDTGDVGLLDRDGFLTLTDRRSRFAKIGGEMVPQGRVEENLIELMADLLEQQGRSPEDAPEIAVTCVPDDRKGERLVVLHTAIPVCIDQWRAAVGEGELPRLYQPRPDQYFEVDAIPKLGTGKTDLKGLKDLALDLVGGS